MKYNYNGTVIELRDKLCRLWDGEFGTMTSQTNLYIRVTNVCNAHCKFCEYHGNKESFDLDKFEKALDDISNRGIVGKIQITGGEPSIVQNLKEIILLIRKYFPNRFIGINSNGCDLINLIDVKDIVDNFAISRHHYEDSINRVIFDSNTIPYTNQLKVFIDVVGNDKVHFSCNIIKGYIDSVEEVMKYLEYCASINCTDVGFVGLMGINEFAKNHRIELSDIDMDSGYNFLKHKEFTKEDNVCKCANYLYLSKKHNKMVNIYRRHVLDTSNSNGLISYGNNMLRDGFSGAEIKII